jgi:hypothetical protein
MGLTWDDWHDDSCWGAWRVSVIEQSERTIVTATLALGVGRCGEVTGGGVAPVVDQ